MKIIMLGLVLLVSMTFAAPPKKMLFFNYPNAPFTVEHAQFSFVENGILIRVDTKNRKDKIMQAHSVGVVFFDVYDRLMDAFPATTTIDQMPNQEKILNYSPRLVNESLASTMVIFPLRARFENGEIWEANLDNLNADIVKVTGFFVAPIKIKL